MVSLLRGLWPPGFPLHAPPLHLSERRPRTMYWHPRFGGYLGSCPISCPSQPPVSQPVTQAWAVPSRSTLFSWGICRVPPSQLCVSSLLTGHPTRPGSKISPAVSRGPWVLLSYRPIAVPASLMCLLAGPRRPQEAEGPGGSGRGPCAAATMVQPVPGTSGPGEVTQRLRGGSLGRGTCSASCWASAAHASPQDSGVGVGAFVSLAWRTALMALQCPRCTQLPGPSREGHAATLLCPEKAFSGNERFNLSQAISCSFSLH